MTEIFLRLFSNAEILFFFIEILFFILIARQARRNYMLGKYLQMGIFIALILLQVLFNIKLSGIHLSTRILFDNLYIVNSGLESENDSACYSMQPDGFMTEASEFSQSIFLGDAQKYGWKFKPACSGNGVIIVDHYTYDSDYSFISINDGSDYSHTDIYKVTVDDKLNVSYEVYSASKPECLISHLDDGITFLPELKVSVPGDAIIEIPYENISGFYSFFDSLYGINSKCRKPDVSDMVHITFVYDKFPVSDMAFEFSFYIASNNVIYFEDEETAQWYSFVPEDFCNMDKLYELIQ